MPSRWLVDIVGRRLTRVVTADELDAVDAPWLKHVASFAGGVRMSAFPATEQEHNLRRLTDPASVRLGPLAVDPAFRRGQALIRARRSSAFTVYDGNLTGHTVRSPAAAGALVSPTRLERWAGCPLRYFFESALSPNTFWVELSNLDFSPGAPTLRLPLGEGEKTIYAGDASASFEEADPFPFLGVA